MNLPGAKQSTSWSGLRPDLKAAAIVAIFVVGLEILSDVIPVAGFVICIPLAIAVYTLQGLLVGWYWRAWNDPASPRAWGPLRLAALSALWTGAVLSPLVALAATTALTTVTLGAALVGAPLTFASSLIDLALNLVFTLFGAWLAVRFSKGSSLGCSCVMLAIISSVFCVLLAAGLVALILMAAHAIPSPDYFHWML
jgi:hypothetical protein